MGVTYREAGKADVTGMSRIRAAEWGEQEYWEQRIWGYMQGEVFPQKALKPRVVYVAVEGDAVLGFIAGHLTRRHECDGELEWINVAAETRGSGIAAELLRRLAAWFVEQKALKICVDVQPTNTVARKFYRRHGAKDLNPHWLVWNDIRVVLDNSDLQFPGVRG
jgi:ribosomal protein S18 acetylase RimI-like enzyme